jgi:hypothetical protein
MQHRWSISQATQFLLHLDKHQSAILLTRGCKPKSTDTQRIAPTDDVPAVGFVSIQLQLNF